MTATMHHPWISKTWTGATRNCRPLPGALTTWQAKCGCGMRGDTCDDRDTAVEQAQQHVDGAA